ncbi:MAG: NIPSNAP family protein [Candidatus Bathyarchaeota archaeon]|nr:NIPSNAP family protein [Candidatus Bathyarchaeota archaeon]MDH5780708.1 NIPSNAP family protein [Candidatus Bathyarchaeota archaeon]
MTILTVDKWMIKPEKQAEHKKLMQKYHKFMKDNAEMCKEMKLVGEYTQMFGGVSGMYVWLVEYDSLADLEKLNKRMEKDEEAKKLMQEWMPLIDPASVSTNVWTAVE